MKKFLFFFLLLMGTVVSQAYDFSAVAPTGQTLYYNIYGTTVTVTYPGSSINSSYSGYTAPTGDLEIPSTVSYNGTTYSVTNIGEYAFAGCSLTSMTIPNSVTSIGEYAFAWCYGLTSVTIPNSVTSIGEGAFGECIGLTSVGIPSSVTSIGEYAFYGVRMVSYCGEATGSPWEANQAGCFYEEGDFIYQDESKTVIVAYIGSGNVVTIPNSVTSIGEYAFFEYSSLTSVTIPNSVTSIGESAFYGCSGLTSVTIPNSVTSIGSAAFERCGSLTSVDIPNSVTSIGGYAFSGCSSLTEIISLSRTAPLLGDEVFSGVDMSIPVNIPCGSQMSYLSQWTYFSNFVEAQGFSFEANSSNMTMGTVEVLTQPTCSAPQAVINAVPANGYVFDHWSNGVTTNPYSFTLTQDTSLTAYFALQARDTVYVPVHDTTYVDVFIHDTTVVTVYDTVIEQLTYYTLSVVSENNNRGLVAGNGTFPEGTEVEIAAIPIQGNMFVQWADGNTENPRLVTVNGNTSYVATFEANPVGVTEVEGVNFTIDTESGAIVVKDAPEMQIRIFDNLGRCLITNKGSELVRMFNMPVTGAYMVQVGNYPAQKVVVVK